MKFQGRGGALLGTGQEFSHLRDTLAKNLATFSYTYQFSGHREKLTNRFGRERFKARDHQAVEHWSYPGLQCKSTTNGAERYSKMFSVPI